MDSETDFFHCLPDEVIQLIFSRILDYESLIRCMSVSKFFRLQASRVSSLLIFCPGNFSSYDEKLHRIFGMVKAFKNLKSLVVRVGQPREERPSWARCMRYAEIGVSVEKFIFMAAKAGDFSQLDSALRGFRKFGELPQGDSSCGSFSVGTSWWPSLHTNLESADGLKRNREFMRTKNSSGNDSKDKGSENVSAKNSVLGNGSNQAQEGNFILASPNISRNIKPLAQFNLHQVIAPSDDVLKRMLPVIHFAIVQGLNDLRDSLPAFVAQFTELRAFLLVDMIESITVFMREHHIQELRSTYLQELNELPDLAEGTVQVGGPISENIAREKVPNRANKDNHLGGKRDRNFGLLDMTCASPLQAVEGTFSESGGTSHNAIFSKRNVSGLKCCPTNNVSASPFQALDTQGLQASKGKEKMAEELDSEAGNMLLVSTSKSLQLNPSDNFDTYLDNVEDGCDLDSVEDGCDGKSSNTKIGLGTAHLTSVKNNFFSHNMDAELSAPLEAFNVSKHELVMSPEAVEDTCSVQHNFFSHKTDVELSAPLESFNNVSKHELIIPPKAVKDTYSVDLDHQGEDQYCVTSEGCRLQGNRSLRNSKADVTGKCSLRKWLKPDSWKKKDFKTARFATGGLHCSDFLEEKLDGQSFEKHLFNHALCKDEQSLSNGTTSGHGNDGMGISRVQSRENHEVLPGSFYHHPRSSKMGFAVRAPESYELQTNRSHRLLLPARQSQTQGNLSTVYGDFLQERTRRLKVPLHLNDGLDFRQIHHNQHTQSLESTAPEPVEGSAHVESWRGVWRERVRRLRDSLQTNSGILFNGIPETERKKLRDFGARKPSRFTENDALSFDYTFWRAEQVSSYDCVVSDVSMCIATNAARPLRDFEKEVLIQAAIAGPLLVATLSHVNNHHVSHQL